MNLLTLALVHAKFQLLETVRVPIAVIGSAVFPALAFAAFVLPQSAVTARHDYAVAATASMLAFAFLANGLFTFGLELSSQRERAWVPYLRTLPGPASARVLGLVLSMLAMSVVATIPVLVLSWLFTAAAPSIAEFLAGYGMLVATAIPGALIGVIIGSTMSMKAATAVTQIAMFGLAFAGGLFLPPQLWPSWLEAATRVLPSRQARELVVAAASGEPLPLWALLGIAGWIAVLGALAVWLYVRDEGRRYR